MSPPDVISYCRLLMPQVGDCEMSPADAAGDGVSLRWPGDDGVGAPTLQMDAQEEVEAGQR